MAKVATKFIKEYPYKIVEEGLHKDRNKVSESLFSLSNEYHGIRAFFDEGSSLESLQGSYFNGIYEYALEDTPNAYKGIIKRTHFMINSVNWVKCKIEAEGNILDLGKDNFSSFKRELNFLDGVLTRSFIWHINDKNINITFKRMLSMNHVKNAFQIIEFESDKDVEIKLALSLDSNVLHWGNHCYYDHVDASYENDLFYIKVKTPRTNQKVVSLMKVDGIDSVNNIDSLDKEVVLNTSISLKANCKKCITRYVVNNIDKSNKNSFDDLFKEAKDIINDAFNKGFTYFYEDNKSYWEQYFAEHDIKIEGDLSNQQGIRFCLFQLQQTYHGFDGTNNIGAKGLTGEAYSGHAFWDSETYCLSYYLLNNISAAKSLLMYRYNTLDKARERAKMLDCLGACYPIATLNGEEACSLWQHASLQFQPSTAVAYAIYHYVNLSDDKEFLKEYGYEMLLEISKFMLTRGSYNQDGTGFGYYCVMGPDEFQMMVNHNTYTNYLAKRTFDYTLEVRKMFENDSLKEIENKCNVDDKFFDDIKNASEKMIILYDENTKLFEQHEGFFKLPHIDIHSIPVTDFPLYNNWSYDRIYRNDIIKQPDVLMFMYLYNQSFTYEQKLNNYNYYEPRTIHESSLSPSVHSILACELDKMDEALNFFGFATRLDLDDYNRNACEGLHTTSISAAWANIVYGFGGVRTDGKVLKINPKIPASWEGYSFKITYKGAILEIKVNQKGFSVSLIKGEPVDVMIKEKMVSLKDKYIEEK